MPGSFETGNSGRRETGGVGEGSACILHIAQRLPDHLFGQTGAFATLGGYARRLADFAVTAATFVDGLSDLAVGNALAKTHVHNNYPLGLR